MKVSKLRALKPTFDNLKTIGRVVYEATGESYWFYVATNAANSVAMGCNWFEIFYSIRNNALKTLEPIDNFKYNLVRLKDGGGTEKLPFIYNSL
ncbi:MAG: hypothetical protein CMH22_06060 [Methylophaga sp.]|nr:hypothetical protein [Methylophaga sp.]|tara:strand:+ start:56327 stop:56608 length:282 start_codon:yes stop_codon:yes gene_type:complete